MGGAVMKIVNLFGGPGSGKSTTAAGLFSMMKMRGHKVELVTEFAKDLTYKKDFITLANQLAVLGEQDHRLRRLEGHVDYVITDSPLMLSIVYAAGIYSEQWFKRAAWGAFCTYDNINFLLKRAKPYATYGRNQNEEQALEIDGVLRRLLDAYGVEFAQIAGNEQAPGEIYSLLFERSAEDGGVGGADLKPR
jgi:nicotinamide riboside kinase